MQSKTRRDQRQVTGSAKVQRVPPSAGRSVPGDPVIALQAMADTSKHVDKLRHLHVQSATPRNDTTKPPLTTPAIAQPVLQGMFWELNADGKPLYIWHYEPVSFGSWVDTGKMHRSKRGETKRGVWRRRDDVVASIRKYCDSDGQVNKLIGIVPDLLGLESLLKETGKILNRLNRNIRGPKRSAGARLATVAGLMDAEQFYDATTPEPHRRGERASPGKRSTALLTSLVGTNGHDELQYVIMGAYAESSDHGHSLHRHGADVTDDQLKRRITHGIAPDEAFSPTPVSTRFKSHEAWFKARSAALAQLQREDRQGKADFLRDRRAHAVNRPAYDQMWAEYLALEPDIRDQEARVEAQRTQANANYLANYMQANFYDPVAALPFDNVESEFEVGDAQFQIERGNFVAARALFLQIRANWDARIQAMLDGGPNTTPRIAPATIPNKPNPPANPQRFSIRRILRHTGKYAKDGLGMGFEEDPTSLARAVPDPSQPSNRGADQMFRPGTRPIAGNLVNTVMTIETENGNDWKVVQFFPTNDPHDIEL